MDVFLVFIVQSVFMFFIDHKYRFLGTGNIGMLLIFQGLIATMYVFVIPLIARGDTASALAYIFGSLTGTYLSHISHKHKGKQTK